MTLLQVMPDDQPDTVLIRTSDAATITAELKAHGVEFFQWSHSPKFDRDSNHDEILAAYSEEIDELKARGGYQLVDIAALRPDDIDPGWVQRASNARNIFFNEHRHTEDEVRFFVAGRGCFYLHLDGRVVAAVCEAGDLLSVPAGTLHWFDMGKRPDFVTIRFFEEEDGWVGHFTGDCISAAFPTLDELLRAQ